MANIYSIPLSDIVSEFNLDFFYKSSDFDKIHVTVDEVSRPGLHLAGFFDHFEPMRIYVCGTVEVAYLQKLSSEERSIIFDHFLSYMCPALIFSRGFQPTPECLEMAKKYNVTVLGCREATSYLVSALIVYLKSALAPRVTRHGVLVEIYGEGILINGDSGIGKSETAIELVKRGHRLIADDAVEIKKVSPHELVGSAPPVLKHYIELRGIGVINVAKLFGMGAVKELKEQGVDAELIDLRSIVPLDKVTILKSLKKTGRLLIVDEDYKSFGVSAEIAAIVAEEGLFDLEAPVKRLALPDVPIPYSRPMEQYVIPTTDKIVKAALKLMDE